MRALMTTEETSRADFTGGVLLFKRAERPTARMKAYRFLSVLSTGGFSLLTEPPRKKKKSVRRGRRG